MPTTVYLFRAQISKSIQLFFRAEGVLISFSSRVQIFVLINFPLQLAKLFPYQCVLFLVLRFAILIFGLQIILVDCLCIFCCQFYFAWLSSIDLPNFVFCQKEFKVWEIESFWEKEFKKFSIDNYKIYLHISLCFEIFIWIFILPLSI